MKLSLYSLPRAFSVFLFFGIVLAGFGQRVSTPADADMELPATNFTLTQSQPESQDSSGYDGGGRGDEVITLEEFEVRSSSMRDAYVASEATTGTRLGGEILDMPFNVAVLTQEMADDFLLDDDDLMGFVSGSTVGVFEDDGEGHGNVNIRGFPVLSLRDGFKYYDAFSFSLNNDRTEILKGPASIMYGRATPGGLKNKISKKPRTKPYYQAEASLSKYSTYNAGVLATGPIIPKKLFYVTSLRFAHNETPIDFYWRENTSYYGKVLWTVSKNSSFSLGLDYRRVRGTHSYGSSPGGYYIETSGQFPLLDGGYISSGDIHPNYALPIDNRTGQIDPYKAVDSVNFGHSTAIRGANIFSDLAYFNSQGPDSIYREDSWAASFLYEQRINRILSFRLSSLYTHYSTDDYYWQYSNNRYYAYRGPILNPRSPFTQFTDRDTGAVQAEMLAKFRTGSIAHRLLILADFTEINYKRTNFTASDKLIAGLPDPVKFLSIYNPDWGNGVDWSEVNQVSHIQHRDDESWGITASYSMSLLKDRLALMASGRYDRVEAHQTDPYLSDNRTDASASYGDYSYSLSASWKIVPQKLSAYINHSTSFNDSSYTLSIDSGTGTFVKPSNSTGYEIGIKGSGLFDKRFSFSASISQIEQENIKDDNPDWVSAAERPPGATQYLGTLTNRGRAIELQADWKLTKNTLIKFGVGRVFSKTLDSTRPWLVGKPLRGVSKWDANAMIRYNFPNTSPLRGLVCGVAADYRSSFIANHEGYWNTTPKVPLYSSDIGHTDRYVNRGWKYQYDNPERWLLQYGESTTPSYLLFRVFVSYKWKWGRFNPMIQVNCTNLTNKNHFTYQGRWYNNGRVFTLTGRVNF